PHLHPVPTRRSSDLAKDRKQLPRFPLAVSIKAKTKQIKKPVKSANIIAKLPGSDPNLKNEYVVLSAHIDHIGIGEPINGDKIYKDRKSTRLNSSHT